MNGNEINSESELHATGSIPHQMYPDEHYPTEGELADIGQNEHYIYVTYPPELKRRLLER